MMLLLTTELQIRLNIRPLYGSWWQRQKHVELTSLCSQRSSAYFAYFYAPRLPSV